MRNAPRSVEMWEAVIEEMKVKYKKFLNTVPDDPIIFNICKMIHDYQRCNGK
jgi:hypothetical protein